MIKKTLIITLLFLEHLSNAQDTLVHFKDLTFASTFEESILTDHFVNKKTDPFLLFMANGTLLNESHLKNDKIRFYDHLKALKEDTRYSNNKKNDKKIKYLYDDIHKSFLQKYELQNKFEDIFVNGNYNCVSASALYALAFEECNIPYTLKEEPTHVYLIAYPEQERILVETTTPQSGYTTLDQAFKEGYVKMLKDQKLISNAEYASQSVNSIFDKFYFKNEEEITLSNLIGIQYSNDAMYKFEDKKYEAAYHQLQKAYLFYPVERISYLMFIACYKIFEEQKTKNIKHATALAELLKFKKYGISDEEIRGEFAHVLQKDLFESENKDELNQYYNSLVSAIGDTVLKKDIAFLYNYENGRQLYSKARYKEALPFFEEALTAKPTNLETANILIGSLAQTLSGHSNTEDVIVLLEQYATRHPYLQTNNLFNKIMDYAYLEQVVRSFDFGNIANGEKYKTAFENHRDKYPDGELDSRILGNAYSRAAVYYFKKGQVSKSKMILKKGLSYDQENYELLMRQRMIK